MSAFMTISSLKPALRLSASEMSRPSVSRSCSVRVTVLFLPALFLFVVVMVMLFGISLGRCPALLLPSQVLVISLFFLVHVEPPLPFPVPLPRSVLLLSQFCSFPSSAAFLCSAASLCSAPFPVSAASLCSDVLHSLLFLHPLLCLRCKSVELIHSSHG